MLLTCTPIIEAGGPLIEVVVVPVTLVGGGLTLAMTPKVKVGGTLVEKNTPKIAMGGALVDTTGVVAVVGGGFIEQCSLPFALGGSLVFILAADTAVANEFSGWVLNTKKGGMSRYEGYPFNSLLKINGVYLGISDTGIDALDGADDNGAPINAEVLTGVNNLGSDMRKVIPDAYLEVRCPDDGRVQIAILYNEAFEATMNTDPVTKPGLYFKRLKPPRGADGTHIQVRFRNVDGSDFDLQTIRLITQLKTRRM